MTEMTPQEAASVWIRVPEVDQELTPRVVGLANILTGLAIAMAGLPMLVISSVTAASWGRWGNLIGLAATLVLVLLFLALRAALWRVYGLAKPSDRPLLYRHRVPGSRRWLPVDWWYLAVFLWWVIIAYFTVPGPVERSAALVPLFLTVYTLAGGLWESKQTWSRRPYLLVAGVVLCGLGWGLHIAGVPELGFAIYPIFGLAWTLAGTAIYHQV